MLKEKEVIRLPDTDAFAAYSLPGKSDHVLIRGKLSNKIHSKGGFVIQRFRKETKSPLFLSLDKVDHNIPFSFDTLQNCTIQETGKQDYLDNARRTIEAIRNGLFDKVVISRIKLVGREVPDIYELFGTLKLTYPKAFVFLYHVPGEGCWCGASPEILLRDQDETCTTMALAGTQSDKGIPVEEVIWGKKEIYEQAVIEGFIEEILSKEQLAFDKKAPMTIKAGQVLHILSEFDIKEVNNPLSLADLLHPGPAICGLPQTQSMRWIMDHEAHDRAHYCGYIGPWIRGGVRSLFINLRSMQIYRDKFALYLGGGLTSDSSASAEWEETELKANTMLAAIDKSLVS